MSVIDLNQFRANKGLASRSDRLAQIRGQLQIVVVDCAYDSINASDTREWLGKIAQFKINAYLDDWSDGVLPLDAGDFVGIHLLLCQQTESDLEIIAGLKLMTHDRCRRFGLVFSAFHALEGVPGTEPHREAILQLIQEADRQQTSVGYLSSWAVRPDAKRSRELARFCRDVTTAMIVQGCREFNVPHSIAFGVQRLKVERYHESLGFKPLTSGGQPLPVFTSRSYMNEALTTALADSTAFSAEAEAITEEYRDLWNARLDVGLLPAADKKAA